MLVACSFLLEIYSGLVAKLWCSPSSSKILTEIAPRTDSEEEEGLLGNSDPETADLIDILKENEVSEDEADSFVDLKLEEEQEEPSVLLTGQGESEEERTSANGVEKEEVGEGEEEQIKVSCAEESEEAKAVSRLSDVWVSWTYERGTGSVYEQ